MGEFGEYANLYAGVVALGFVAEAVRATLWGLVVYIAVRKAIEHSTGE